MAWILDPMPNSVVGKDVDRGISRAARRAPTPSPSRVQGTGEKDAAGGMCVRAAQVGNVGQSAVALAARLDSRPGPPNAAVASIVTPALTAYRRVGSSMIDLPLSI
jgi:hypothetical protein